MRLPLFASLLCVACAGPTAVTGETPPPTDATDHATFPRLAPRLPSLEAAWINASFTGNAFTLAHGDGFGDVTLRWNRFQPPFGCSAGAVRWSSARVTGEVATVTLTPENDLVLHPTAEGPITLELSGTYTPVLTCEGEHLTPRRIDFALPAMVKEVTGYQVDTRCPDPLEWAVAVPTNVGAPPLKVRPLDRDGVPFTAFNADELAQVPLTLRAPTPRIATSSSVFAWSFTGPGDVAIELGTSLPVRSERRLKVATPQSLSALKLSGEVKDLEGPVFVPQYEGGTADGVELCAAPSAGAFTLISETPEVCEPVQLEVWQSKLGVGARFLRAGVCRVRVFVTGRERLGNFFEVTNPSSG
ncbi:MAG: hypothetical protein U0228_31145 [Myxococcaceae bacterium]